MRTVSSSFPAAMALILLIMTAHFMPAAGPLTPQDSPAPTMKTLQELWDKMVALEGQVGVLQEQLGAVTATPGSGFPIEFVDVLNAGNIVDSLNSGTVPGIGAVSYVYRIGKYEVTNAQYAQFLNAVAAADPNSLYSTNMAGVRGGITRSGATPNFSYSVKPAMGDKPVNFVGWYDACRFCNWLHNGSPTGVQDATTTEDGAYTLTGVLTITLPGSDPTHGANGRNAGARFHLPSENEWYKAAYYQPVAQGGDADSYWLYPTRSNSAPTIATADATGKIDNDSANIANYLLGADWNGQDGNVTTVGSGGTGSESFYGAADLAANVWEWNEHLSGNRGLRGGSWTNGVNDPTSSFRIFVAPHDEADHQGFRVAAP